VNLPQLPYALVFTEQYNRRAAKFLKQHPDLRQPYLKTLQLLEANPSHPSLRLHALRGKFEGLHQSVLPHHARVADPEPANHPGECWRP
jgi:mRNA-degrading endonuclease YafQ of YafQ-DinJ toxin-antitoxin module